MTRTLFQLLSIAVATTACVPPGSLPWGGFGSTSGGGGGGSHGTSTPTAPADTPRAPEALAVTGSAKSLKRLTTSDAHEAKPRLAADGSRLLATTWRDEVVDGQYTGNLVEQGILAMRPDGRGRSMLTKRGVVARDPAWLAKTFVYVSNAMGSPQLVRAAKVAAGAAVSVVVRADDAPSIGGVSASKDGTLIAFHAAARDVWTIGTVRPDGSDLMMLGDGMNPQISPDGTRIVFERQVGDRWHLFTMTVDGDDLTQVTDLDGGAGSPTWSPDGAWIVFTSNVGAARFRDPSAVWNLFAIRPDGTGLTQLTDGPRKSTEPSWGSDGWIYFASNEAGSFDLWRLRPTLE